MTSIGNLNNETYWDYTGGRQFAISLGVISRQLKNILMAQHALKDLN